MDDLKHDIEKYLRGELSSSEMHQLEKKALDDPFLADALEGASMISADELSGDLASLRKKIQQRVEPEKKSVSLWYWPLRIAAGLLILIVSGYIIFTLTDQNTTTQQLALNKVESNAPSESPAVSQPMDSVQPSPLSKVEEPEPVVLSENKKTISKVPVEAEHQPSEPLKLAEESATSGDVASPPVSVAELSPVESAQDDAEIVVSVPAEPKRIQQEEVAFERADKKKMRTEKPTTSVAPMAERMASGAKISSSRVLHGKVTDAEDGTGMPGVNVIVKGTTKSTVTDAEGNYQLSLNDSSKDELLFSFVGMQNVEAAIPPAVTDSVNVKLSPDYASLSEVVVVGYASLAEGVVKDGENTYEVASPAGGRKAYKTYLVSNMKYPQMAIENKIEGKVTIQFVVDTSGLLSDFRVIKGIGFGCDQEVIRLIKDGPKWTATKRNDAPLKSKVKVRLKFKLPQ